MAAKEDGSNDETSFLRTVISKNNVSFGIIICLEVKVLLLRSMNTRLFVRFNYVRNEQEQQKHITESVSIKNKIQINR